MSLIFNQHIYDLIQSHDEAQEYIHVVSAIEVVVAAVASLCTTFALGTIFC